MAPHWLAGFICLYALVGMGHTASLSTTETLVITTGTDTLQGAEAEPTSEEPNLPIKLTEMDVRSEVSMRYAHTSVVARVRNPAKRAQEATFRVLLPETAFISGFVMILDGKSYKAYVKEKEEAKQIYSDAVSQGLGAAHIAAKARDSNHFTVSVNVEATSSAVFNLTYEELLVRRNGVYNHIINLHPGALVPKLTVTVHIKEVQKITELRVPEIRTGNEIDATKDDTQNSKAVITRGHDDREAIITFKPDLEEQKMLIQIYKDKSKHSLANSWGEPPNPDGVLGQFVVQYDVDRPKDGEVIVNDGYFVHFYAPSSLPPLNKYVVFVLDTSGSMMDRKIVQLREAMQTILSDLNPGDYFSIVEFASGVTVHDLNAVEQEPPKASNRPYYFESNIKPPTLVPPSQVTPENIAKAKTIVSRLDANGGTNIGDALDTAVKLIQKGVDWTVSNTTNTTDTTSTTPEPTPVTEKKILEPIIIFLTDGDPTVGETNPTTIINHVTEKNYGENKATIYSLAFGEDADRKFLRKLSLRSDGFMRHIYEAADAALQLREFYQQVSSPLLADVKFVYPPDQVKEGSITKNKFRTINAGSEVVVAGRVADAATELTPHWHGFCGVDDGNRYGRKRYEVSTKVPVARKKGQYYPLERLWSYLTIKQLLDEKDAVEGTKQDGDSEDTPEKKALRLALKYEFVTPLTSLVVVKPNATKEVDAESVDKPSNTLIGLSLPLSIPSRPVGGFAYQTLLAGPSSFSRPSALFAAVSAPGQPLAAQYDAFEEEEQFDVDAAETEPLLPSITTVAQSSTTLDIRDIGTPTSSDANSSMTHQGDRLLRYHLEKYKWAEPLLDSIEDAIVISHNGTNLHLKLSLNDQPPKPSKGDDQCDNAVGEGGAGLCVYLTRCETARNITEDMYSSRLCIVEGGYAGVCCLQANIDVAKVH